MCISFKALKRFFIFFSLERGVFFYQHLISDNKKILNLKFSRQLGLNFAYIPLNSVSVKNWNSLKYLSTTMAKEGTCTHSVCFNGIFRSDTK